MVISCCVFACTNRHSKQESCNFFLVPKVIEHQELSAKELSEKRRTAWLAKINRKDWVPGPGSRVCSDHFISSKPAALFDQNNPDWVPTLKMGYSSGKPDCSRHQRHEERKKRAKDIDAAHVLLELHQVKRVRQESDPVPGVACQTDDARNSDEKMDRLETGLERLRKDNQAMRGEVAHLKSCGAQKNLSPDTLKEDPQLLKFYTGIPDWTVFMALYNLVHSAIPDTPINKLSKFSMILMFLMKIRLNLFDEDLGYKFGVHHSTVSRNFHKVLNVMSVRTAHLIKWPDRETLRKTLPTSFRRFFKKCCVIIDCSEVFVETPSNLLARAQVWSNYKHHSTLKFLIGITPQGTVSYISPCVGGRMSDKEIVEQSNLIDFFYQAML